MNDGAKHASKGHNRASLILKHSLYRHTKEPLLPSNSGCNGRQERLFLYIMGSKTMQNRTKTARQISKTDFYFVTSFYHLYDICIVDIKTFLTRRHEEHVLGKKTCAEKLLVKRI